MVINGIDLQTNSHTTGVLHNWSGRNAEGYPGLTALFAANHAPDIAMPYVNFGGFGATEILLASLGFEQDVEASPRAEPRWLPSTQPALGL